MRRYPIFARPRFLRAAAAVLDIERPVGLDFDMLEGAERSPETAIEVVRQPERHFGDVRREGEQHLRQAEEEVQIGCIEANDQSGDDRGDEGRRERSPGLGGNGPRA